MPAILHLQSPSSPPVVGTSQDRPRAVALDLIPDRAKRWRVLHTSVSDADDGTVVPHSNGFVCTVLRAWQQDQHLELRPDDVWLSVLTQFSFYLNGENRSEALRDRFVNYAGRRRLEIAYPHCQTVEQVDVPAMTQRFVDMIREHLVDETLADWLLPVFSTTLPRDKTVAAAAFLGTMSEYFGYAAILGCSFPSVTLHGEREDWVDLLGRMARLAEFDTSGNHMDNEGNGADSESRCRSMVQWSRALTVVVEFMVASFDRPNDERVRDFWRRACHSVGSEASGEPSTMSGWLTTFCWWRADGAAQRAYSDSELAELEQLRGHGPRLKLGGVEFPIINQEEIPSAYTEASITFHLADGKKLATVLTAGSKGARLLDKQGSAVQPFSCWWLLTHEKKGPRRISQREPLVVKRKGARAGDKGPRETASVQPSQQRKITLDEE
ncbi:hypothetical protein MGU_08933 [Metarhizium guizhouense ARSEF 977]|uniref:DUF4419 domain-containing protein n=1 Tax=Metarhizium guizhouense (strain ARSEF 977) TaxID=1276136 RepID=A0A0B4GMM7_METGA|nr:hypothetical protein MGU_08933 [Metarhizium guizhouense ARSEF 977]